MQKDKNNFKLRKPNNDTSKELTYADNAITVLTWSVLKKFKTSPTIKKKKITKSIIK
jgi:hypothetical protein